MSKIEIISPDFGSSTIPTKDQIINQSKHLTGAYTVELAQHIANYLASRNQNPDIVVKSYGNRTLNLYGLEDTANAVVLHISGSQLQLVKKQAYIIEAIRSWFSPYRPQQPNSKYLRYYSRQYATVGNPSKIKPNSTTNNHNIYIIDTIVVHFE